MILARCTRVLRHVFAEVLREDLVDQRLVAYAPATRLLAELIEYARVDANRDQLTRFVTERRATHASHRSELLGRRVRNVRVVNPSRRTPRVRGDSHAAR